VFETVLFPLRPGETTIPRVETIEGDAAGKSGVSVSFADGRVDLYASFADAATHKTGALSFDGVACLLRLGAGGETVFREVVG
jgi:hypothetical protein